ncbi:NAD+ synthase [Halosquirtibacter laminarini]|uniref:NAD+ synthase n=1 Tax=Halosquirtibacter laminarini TaxID=3374600 RepID=A0AC61NGX3_9BACT|nr:NAD+ synthase [Prolixibacteraceae bacterium]
MKIALSQLNYHVGNFEKNTEKIIQHIEKAKKKGADVVVFSELAICGYYPQDLLEKERFILSCMESIDKICNYSHDITVIVGAPSINNTNKGKRLYNSAFILREGKIYDTIHKTLLPTYDIFDEYRHFEPNKTFRLVNIDGKKIAITICEDIWDEQSSDNNFAQKKLYNVSPMEELSKLNPDIAINLSASPFSHDKETKRKKTIQQHASKYKLPFIYVSQVGAQTEILFDGGSVYALPDGSIQNELAYFNEDFAVVDTENRSKPTIQPFKGNIGKIHDALVAGIKDYFNKSGFSSATLGLSGGIDSAVTVVLAVEALGAENVRVLLMPSKYSSDHSVKDAEDLAKNLGIQYDLVPIVDPVLAYEKSLSDVFKGLEEDVTEENIQARIRGTLMMAISNKFGNILLNTSNKSEAAVGYGTLYGDMNGGLSVLGDVYKTDVFKLAHYINRDEEIIPVNTIVKPPSAELRPGQQDSDSLPDYDLLDSILYLYIEKSMSNEQIISHGYPRDVVERIVGMVDRNEYKRFQCPPIIRVSSKAFGGGRKMPIVAKYRN